MNRVAAVLGAALAAAGCVSVIPTPKAPDGLYTIDVRDTPHVSVAKPVRVREPEAQKLFSGDAVVAIDATGAARLIEGVQWSDSATRLMQIALLDILDGEGAAVSGRSGASAAYELAWRLSDFSLMGQEARVELELTLLDARTRDALGQTVTSATADARSLAAVDRMAALQAAARAALSSAAEFVAAHANAPEA